MRCPAIAYDSRGVRGLGGGWLAERGFADFAGSGVVHMTGGFSALVGGYIIGPRSGLDAAEPEGAVVHVAHAKYVDVVDCTCFVRARCR